MLSPINKRRLEILEWERDNRNLNNRAVLGQSCTYRHSANGGCAVGRLVPEHLAETLYGRVAYCFNRLPNDVQELGLKFLRCLQNFHDSAGYFEKDGLSSFGVYKMNSLIDYVHAGEFDRSGPLR